MTDVMIEHWKYKQGGHLQFFFELNDDFYFAFAGMAIRAPRFVLIP